MVLKAITELLEHNTPQLFFNFTAAWNMDHALNY